MVEIEIKTLGNFIVILFKNVFEIMELSSFPNSHHKLCVRINMNELKILTSDFIKVLLWNGRQAGAPEGASQYCFYEKFNDFCHKFQRFVSIKTYFTRPSQPDICIKSSCSGS